MNKKFVYLILFVSINTLFSMLALGAATNKTSASPARLDGEAWPGRPVSNRRRAEVGRSLTGQRTFILPDGFMLKGIDGKITGKDSNDGWFFEFDSAVLGSSKITGLTKLELLPSSTLARMIADANTSSTMGYRLWASVTKYKGRNYIFPIRFLPFSIAGEISPETSQPSQPALTAVEGPIHQKTQEPDDELGIPKEILEKLEAGSISPSARRGLSDEPAGTIAGKQTKIKQDFILTNRIGFLIKQSDGSMAFSLDALGLNTGDTFRLLPCQVLELTERLQAAEVDRVRFKIAGIVTEYQGEEFLLLHRAERTYNYGNFGR